MAYGHTGNAALGLRRLAGIADDEGIDHGQRAGYDFGKTIRRQCDRLAGQPFQRPMRAHVNERVGLRDVPQPQAECDQCMPRRQNRIVIIGAPFRRPPAIGRQRHQNIAEFLRAEMKGAGADIRIG